MRYRFAELDTQRLADAFGQPKHAQQRVRLAQYSLARRGTCSGFVLGEFGDVCGDEEAWFGGTRFFARASICGFGAWAAGEPVAAVDVMFLSLGVCCCTPVVVALVTATGRHDSINIYIKVTYIIKYNPITE